MKATSLVVLLFAFVVSGWAEERGPYLLIASHTEKCYECSMRYSMVCGSDSDCNVPLKTVDDYLFFVTAQKAVTWINEYVTKPDYLPDHYEVDQYTDPRFIRTFKGLYKIERVQLTTVPVEAIEKNKVEVEVKVMREKYVLTKEE